MFPIKPLLDRVIVREIPVAEYYRVDEQSKLVDLGNANIKVLSDRGYVEAVGSGVKDVKVGDTVMFDEFARNDEVFLNPADKNRSDLPHYFRIREADLQGVVLKCNARSKYTHCTLAMGHDGDHDPVADNPDETFTEAMLRA